MGPPSQRAKLKLPVRAHSGTVPSMDEGESLPQPATPTSESRQSSKTLKRLQVI
jgi:hypothetical protein